MANAEDAISSPVDLSSVISRCQDALQYAGSEVNFFETSLYMAPGDMLLRHGRVTGYNNLIVIATDSPDAGNDTGEKGLVRPASPRLGQPARG